MGIEVQCVSDEHVQWALRFNMSVMSMFVGNRGSMYQG